MLKRLFPSMFDGDFDPKRLCLTWPVDCCVYAWRFSLCACSALMLKASLSTLVVHPCCCCFVVIAIARHNVLQNEPHVPAHERLVDDICCCCSCVVIVVTIAQHDMIVLCTRAQGLVVCWRFTRRNMKRTRPCCCQWCVTWCWKWRALVHKALLLSPLCNTMWNASVDIKLKLCAHTRWLMHSLRFGWESSCSSAWWLWLMHLRIGHQLSLNCNCIIVNSCLSNNDSQYKSLCACAWGACCWHMLLSKPCLLLSPLRHTICK